MCLKRALYMEFYILFKSFKLYQTSHRHFAQGRGGFTVVQEVCSKEAHIPLLSSLPNFHSLYHLKLQSSSQGDYDTCTTRTATNVQASVAMEQGLCYCSAHGGDGDDSFPDEVTTSFLLLRLLISRNLIAHGRSHKHKKN